MKQCQWSAVKINGSSPASRHGHSAVLYNDKECGVFGGKRSPEDGLKFFNDIVCYDFEKSTWEAIKMGSASQGIPAVRCWQSCDSVGQWMIIYGGFYMERRKEFYFDDTWIADLKAQKWIKVQVKEKAKPHMRNRTITGIIGVSKSSATGEEQMKEEGVNFWIQGGNYFDSKTRKDEFFGDSWNLKLTWKQETNEVVGQWKKTEGRLNENVTDMDRGHHTMVMSNDGKCGYVFGGEKKRVRYNDFTLVEFFP